MGDQPMEALDDVDWSDDSHMECDPGASWDMVTEESTRRYEDFTHPAFVKKLHLQILPNDWEHSEGFDTPTTFRIGDPNVHFHAAANHMKPQGPLVNLNGTHCLALFWPE